ncbi:MAG: PAS domain S-box protein [Candidatus Acidiferrales bacterium]
MEFKKKRTDPSPHSSAPVAAMEAPLEKLLEIVTRSQLSYRELIDNLDHAVFTLSSEGVFRVANRYLADLLGVSFTGLIGSSFDDFIAEPTRAQARDALALLMQEGRWAGRILVRLKNIPEPRFFDCRLVIVAAHGDSFSINGSARDVTAQQDSETRFKELFQSLSEGIFFTTPEGRLLDANPALVRMLGYESKEQMQTFNFREMYAEPSHREFILRQMLERGSVQDQELFFRRRDGALVRCLISGFVVRDTFGHVARLQGTLVDITQRFEIEKRLEREQEFVQRLIASFPDIIATLDLQGRFTYISPRVEEVLGYAPQTYIGVPPGKHASPEDLPRLHEMFRDLMAGKTSLAQLEYRTRHADGSWRTLRILPAPLYDSEGKINGVVASARDVTEAKRVEQQLQQSEKLASMGQMVAGAAHELNNPLTAILGVSDLLHDRATDDVTRRHTELILQQARRAAAIVQDLLSFSRPAAAGREKIHVEEIVRSALDSRMMAMREKKISVVWEAEQSLPAMEADSRLLSQVFTNLFLNAEQAIAARGESGNLRVSIARDGSRIGVSIADDGLGISPENLDKIFDAFFSTKRPGGGSGLGLTICLAVIKEHGGTIEVKSSPGNGASFRVLLPFAEISAPHASAASNAPVSPSASAGLRGRSALVIDDEEAIREIVQEGLGARGMSVESASSAEEAIDWLAKTSCEIAICDFNLPGLSGPQLFEKLHASGHAAVPRFVFMTGELPDPSTVAALGQKGAYILQKPFHISDLAKLLSEILAAH